MRVFGGGHLAASLGVFWQEDYLKAEGNNRPNALILSYPVITSDPQYTNRGSFDYLLGEDAIEEQRQAMSVEKHINPLTPPTFLWHTVEDGLVPVENSILFAMELRKNNIPFELHIYPNGAHGLSTATEETGNDLPHVASWMGLCTEWLKDLFK